MSEELHSLAAPYALDALDELERRRFESHLAQCAECREEVDTLLEVASHLVEGDTQPSSGLRASTLEMIASTPQAPPSPPLEAHSGTRGSAGSAADSPGPAAPAAAAPVPPPRRPAVPRWLLGAAAAVVLVVVAAAVVVALDDDANDDEVATVLEAPDATVFVMTSDDPAREATDLEVVHSATHDATVVVGDHVHSAGEGSTYQLWGVTPDGGMLDAGVFDADQQGEVEVPVGTPSGVAGWAVTVEPDGGSDEPSGDPVFVSRPI